MPSPRQRILCEHVGVERGTQAFADLSATVAAALAQYPRAKQILDGFETVQLAKLRKLQKAVHALREADAALDEGTRFAREGLRIVDGRPAPAHVVDVPAFAAAMNAALNGAITTLQWATNQQPKKRRRSEAARDWLLAELATAFRQHYQLDPRDCRANLADFIRAVLKAKRIPYERHWSNVLRSGRLTSARSHVLRAWSSRAWSDR